MPCLCGYSSSSTALRSIHIHMMLIVVPFSSAIGALYMNIIIVAIINGKKNIVNNNKKKNVNTAKVARSFHNTDRYFFNLPITLHHYLLYEHILQ